jgi:hypothetical protein
MLRGARRRLRRHLSLAVLKGVTRYLLATLCGFSVASFAREMPKFAPPNSAPKGLRWLAFACAGVGFLGELAAPAASTLGAGRGAVCVDNAGAVPMGEWRGRSPAGSRWCSRPTVLNAGGLHHP